MWWPTSGVMRRPGRRVNGRLPRQQAGADSRGRGDRPQRALSARRCGAAGPRPTAGARPGGRAQSGARPGRPAEGDRGPLGPAGRRGARADLRWRARRRRRRPDHPERPALHGGRDRGHRRPARRIRTSATPRRRLLCVVPAGQAGAATGRHQHRPDLDHRAGSPRAGHGRGPGDQLRPEPEAQPTRPGPGRSPAGTTQATSGRQPFGTGVADRVAGHRWPRTACWSRTSNPSCRPGPGWPACWRWPAWPCWPGAGWRSAPGGWGCSRRSAPPRDSSRPCCWPRT